MYCRTEWLRQNYIAQNFGRLGKANPGKGDYEVEKSGKAFDLNGISR